MSTMGKDDPSNAIKSYPSFFLRVANPHCFTDFRAMKFPLAPESIMVIVRRPSTIHGVRNTRAAVAEAV